MRATGRWGFVLRGAALCLLLGAMATSAWAQGGQLGGFGGGNIGSSLSGELVSSENILSPGDAGDWLFLTRDGETIIFMAHSRNFDPVLEIVDDKGKKVAENDDLRRGEQDSQLLYYFPKGGKYKALVKAAKPGAGGEYTFKIRRFLSQETRIGVRASNSFSEDSAGYVRWHRFSATTGQTLVVTTHSMAPLTMELLAPNGETISQSDAYNGKDFRSQFFRAKTTGIHYLRLQRAAAENLGYALTLALARTFQTEIGRNAPAQKLEAGGLDLWNFKGKAGDLISLQANSATGNVVAALTYLPPEKKEDEPQDLSATGQAFSLFRSNPKMQNVVIAVLNRDGNYQARVTQASGQQSEYTLASSHYAKTPPANAPLEGRLPLGGAEYWAIESKAGEILRFEGVSEQFDLALTLFDPQGNRIATDDDGGGNRNALLTAALTVTGRYLLSVESFGNGGSGAYRVRRIPNPVRNLAFDKREQGRIGADSNEVWTFNGKAGQTIILNARSADFDTRLSVRSAEGVEVASDDDSGDGTNSLLSVRLPLDGAYTIWVFAKRGGGAYVLQLMNAP